MVVEINEDKPSKAATKAMYYLARPSEQRGSFVDTDHEEKRKAGFTPSRQQRDQSLSKCQKCGLGTPWQAIQIRAGASAPTYRHESLPFDHSPSLAAATALRINRTSKFGLVVKKLNQLRPDLSVSELSQLSIFDSRFSRPFP